MQNNLPEAQFLFSLLYILAGVLALVTGLAYAFWWFRVKRPEQWNAWVDRESEFWSRHGGASVVSIETRKRWEKGPLTKVLAGIAALLGTFGLVIIGGFLLLVRVGFFG